MKKILVTGAAGFIGSHVAKKLAEKGHQVIGIDNFSHYYNPTLKQARVDNLLKKIDVFKIDILDNEQMDMLFADHNFDLVVHLAAQPGVRYSLNNPKAYLKTNIEGTSNIFDLCTKYKVKKVVFASSSSVYGENEEIPYSEKHSVNSPISVYAMTKIANEMQARIVSKNNNIEMIGLRFFTVYGPWNRPDMALYKFANAINKDLPIDVYNNGDLQRDFTYVGDITAGVLSAVEKSFPGFEVFNLGNSETVSLMDFIGTIEKHMGKKAKKNYLEMQKGDMEKTFANITKSEQLLHYKPKVSIDEGIKEFVKWFKEYHQITDEK